RTRRKKSATLPAGPGRSGRTRSMQVPPKQMRSPARSRDSRCTGRPLTPTCASSASTCSQTSPSRCWMTAHRSGSVARRTCACATAPTRVSLSSASGTVRPSGHCRCQFIAASVTEMGTFLRAPRASLGSGPTALEPAMSKQDSKSAARAIAESAHQTWLAGLGAFARAREEGSRAFEDLIARGAELEKQTRSHTRQALDRLRETMVASTRRLQRSGLDSYAHLQQLIDERV